jgi:cell division protein FtsL
MKMLTKIKIVPIILIVELAITAAACIVIAWQTQEIMRRQQAIDDRGQAQTRVADARRAS